MKKNGALRNHLIKSPVMTISNKVRTVYAKFKTLYIFDSNDIIM